MNKRINAFVLNLSNNFWLIPLTLNLWAWVLATFLIALDRTGTTGWLNAFEQVEGARSVLTAVASSSITVAGTVFSLVMVVLVLASQQYGPLIVSTMIRDRTLQLGIGVFTASFVYSLRVLQSLEVAFLSPLASSIGVLIGFVDVGVLIFILHRISSNIRYNTIIANITARLHKTIDKVFPDQQPHAASIAIPEDFYNNAAPIHSSDTGYLELVLKEQLVSLAVEKNCILSLRYRPGTFFIPGAIIAYVYPASAFDEDLQHRVNEALVVDSFRTPEQDVELIITQLATIAVRALSPAVNDPYTAISCIDRLGETLSTIGGRPNPPRIHADAKGNPRLVTRPATFSSLLALAFDQIRHYGINDMSVQMHLLKTIRMIGECLHDAEEEDWLHTYAGYIREEALEHHLRPYEQQDIEHAYKQAVRALVD